MKKIHEMNIVSTKEHPKKKKVAYKQCLHSVYIPGTEYYGC